MNREEYMKELARYLRKLPPADLQDALDYFQEGFDAVGEAVSYTHLTLPTTPYV